MQSAPKTADMIAVLKEAPVYRALNTYHDFDETLLQNLDDEEIWGGFAEKLLEALANILICTEEKKYGIQEAYVS